MNSSDFRVLFLYEWKNKHNAAKASRNINAIFGNGSVKERTIRPWYAKFETGVENLTNVDWGRPESNVDNKVLRAIVEKNPDNIVRDYAKESFNQYYIILFSIVAAILP